MKKYSKIIVAVIIGIVFIGTFVFLYVKSQPEPVVYNEYTPKIGDVYKTTVITGKIEPRNEINIKPQISGIITDIYKEAGQIVQAGEVIAKVKVIPDMTSLSSAEARVQLAELNLRQSQIDYDRNKQLYDKNLIAATEYDKSRLDLQQKKHELAAANDNLSVVRDGISKSNATASTTLIRSTISGMILDIPVKVGNTVILSNNFNDGTTVATMANMKDLIFKGNIDETEVGLLSLGVPMKITVGALQDESLTAHLEYISPKAVESNGANQFEIKAAIHPAFHSTGSAMAHQLRAGYSANAEIILQSAKHVLTVPESAIEFNGDKTFVYVKKTSPDSESDEATYEKKPVVIGISDGVNIEIKKGLTTKDVVRGLAVVADSEDKE